MTKYIVSMVYTLSMEVIYIDSLFFLNLAIDYILLLTAAQVCGVRLRRWRYLAAAFIGAAYAVLIYLPRLGFLASPIMKLAAAWLMCLIAFGTERRMWRCTVIFLAVSAAFGGFIWALSLAGLHPAFDLRTLLLSFALCYLLLRLVFRGKLKLADTPRAEVGLTLCGQTVKFLALVDTGNSLSDPISGGAVIVVCPHAILPLFRGHEQLLELDAVEFISAASALPEFKGRLRLIPYSSVGGCGMLAAFRPERLTVDGREREALAALSPNACGDGYEGII